MPTNNEPETPQMSEIETVGNIFFSPSETFEDLRRKPRFLIAGIVISLLAGLWGFALYYKVGEAGFRTALLEQIERSPQAASISQEQKNAAVDMQVKMQFYLRFAVPVFVFISFFLGGLFYFLGAKAFGGSGGYMHGVSVWIYSSLPPGIIGAVANLIVLAFKPAEEIDFFGSQRGLIHASPAFFIDGKSQPVLATILGTFDIFFIWGWILAAIGLRITNRLSSGAAWAVVLIFALFGTLLRVIGAYFGGAPN